MVKAWRFGEKTLADWFLFLATQTTQRPTMFCAVKSIWAAMISPRALAEAFYAALQLAREG